MSTYTGYTPIFYIIINEFRCCMFITFAIIRSAKQKLLVYHLFPNVLPPPYKMIEIALDNTQFNREKEQAAHDAYLITTSIHIY